jgi:hypothetical protein
VVDAISVIVLAVAKAAAATAGRRLAEGGYVFLRGRLVERYGQPTAMAISRLEGTPDSAEARRGLARTLDAAGARNDVELANLAQDVVNIIDGDRVGPTSPVERAVRAGGLDAIQRLLQAHVERVASIRAQHRLDDVDLLTGRLAGNRSLPADVRDNAANLHAQFAAIVGRVADRIEDTRYRDVESSVQELDASRKQREIGQQLVQADKRMHISYETMRLTVEFFRDINELLLGRIGTESVSPAQLSNLMFGNAVLVFEITEFVISFLRRFTLETGYEPVHAEAIRLAEGVRETDAELEQRSRGAEIPPETREAVLRDIQGRAEALDELGRQWTQYIDDVDKLQQVVGEVKKTVPGLELVRDSAKSQIATLQAIALLRSLKGTMHAIQGAIDAAGSLRLAPLSSDRVRILVGAG